MEVLEYVASPTGSKFHVAEDFVRAIMGPIGSGKSVTCIMDMLKHAVNQSPNKKGLRKTRWAVIRNTYRELIDTTVKTFFDWIPEHLGNYAKVDMQFTLYQMLPDGTFVHAEFLFRALDRPNDVKKLLSLEITGAFINEAKEVPRAVVEMAQGRCGRYPSKRDGGPTWFGLLMDTNPPDADHWWYKLFEETRPDNHKLFRQPSGVSSGAENKHNLPLRYYENMMAGKDQEWVNVYVHGEYGFVSSGKAIYPEYNDGLHFMTTPIRHLNQPSTTIYVGIDFGLTPAAVIGFFTPMGQLVIADELVTFNMGAVSFGKMLHRMLSSPVYSKCTIEVYGDPAGEQRSQTDEMTPYMILAHQGIVAWPTFTNDVSIRREAVAKLLTELGPDGKPMLVVTEKATMVRKGFIGGYEYRRMQVVGSERYAEKPDKNRYSHVHDALQYLVLGAVGSDQVIGGTKHKKLDYSRTLRGVR
jgi:PBSX family phage terminase large subunit